MAANDAQGGLQRAERAALPKAKPDGTSVRNGIKTARTRVRPVYHSPTRFAGRAVINRSHTRTLV